MDTLKQKQVFNFVLQSLNHLLWPAVCINCGQSIHETDKNLCKKCWSEILLCSGGDYCKRCGRDVSKFALLDSGCPDCQSKEFHFDGIARGGIYKDALQQMILSFKNGRTELDSTVGFLCNCALEGSTFYNDIELLVPVPLHWSRRLFRGYNHSHLIAKKIKHPTARICTDLVRKRRTKLQSVMGSPTARTKNVAGAFTIRHKNNFTNRKICLIDDIKTSGATLNECAKTLKQAGASKVFALVLAVAGQKTN
ncbi:MAG: ComF family protein [Sedimentisphaerales bacterium]|nr:ComF family protein [Sedimentisphaerales bacterium]